MSVCMGLVFECVWSQCVSVFMELVCECVSVFLESVCECLYGVCV